METEKILFVDDEPSALEGYRRILHREFEIDTAVGATDGLNMAAHKGPYAVVVSDMRMPEMDGAEFLTRVRELYPETVRMAITGYADIETASHAINEARIFLFLTKPCEKEVLKAALNSGLEQYRLVKTEKEVLEKTLSGSVKILTEMLGLLNPAAFSRASRIRVAAQHMVNKLKLPAPWRFEVAASLSQLGTLTLNPELMDAYYNGDTLDPKDQAKFDSHPAVAASLLASIPRLEQVAWLIGHQRTTAVSFLIDDHHQPQDVIDGARILSVSIEYDRLRGLGHSHEKAMEDLKSQPQLFDVPTVELLEGLRVDVEEAVEVHEVRVAELRPGVILDSEVRTTGGLLVVARGQEVSTPLMIRLRNFYERKAIPEKVSVRVPHKQAAAVS